MPVWLSHTEVGPTMVPVLPTDGVGFTVTPMQVTELVPHALDAETQTLPEVLPKVTVIERVPCPAVMMAPGGTVQFLIGGVPTGATE